MDRASAEGGMTWGPRWTEEQFEAMKRAGKLREHKCVDEADEPKKKRGPKPGTGGRPKAKKALRIPTLDDHFKSSPLEVWLLRQIVAECMPDPMMEFHPLPGRRFRLDFAWPDKKKAVEVQGMVHRIKSKFKRDIEKRAELMLAGWKVLEVDGDSIRSGEAIKWVARLLS